MNNLTSTTLIIVAIFMMAVAPPIGVLMIILACVGFRGQRKRTGRYKQAVQARHRLDRQRTLILACKSLP